MNRSDTQEVGYIIGASWRPHMAYWNGLDPRKHTHDEIYTMNLVDAFRFDDLPDKRLVDALPPFVIHSSKMSKRKFKESVKGFSPRPLRLRMNACQISQEQRDLYNGMVSK